MKCDLCGEEISRTKSSTDGGQLTKVFIREIKVLLAGCEMGFKDENITTIGAIEGTVDKLLAEVEERTKI